MTELAIRPDTDIQPADDSPQMSTTMMRLADWANEARAAHTLAQSLCRTSFVPKHFQGKPEETAAAILTGYEMGMSPMAAVRAIFVFGGTPGMYAKAMVAVVKSKGHDVWVEEQSDERVVVRGQRKGSPHIYETTWDRARVVKAKLTGNAKYQESPQQMMTARGQAEICRQVAPDALFGIPYAIEEIEDFDDTPVRAEVVAAPRVTVAEILGTPEPQPEPEAELVEDLPAREKASPAQVGLLQQLCAEDPDTGSDKGRRLFVVGRIVGRGIGSFNDLTKTEASAAIDAFEGKKRRTPKPAEPREWDDAETAQPPLVGE